MSTIITPDKVEKRGPEPTAKGKKGWDVPSTTKTTKQLIVEKALKHLAEGKDKVFNTQVAALMEGLSPQLEFALSQIEVRKAETSKKKN